MVSDVIRCHDDATGLHVDYFTKLFAIGILKNSKISLPLL